MKYLPLLLLLLVACTTTSMNHEAIKDSVDVQKEELDTISIRFVEDQPQPSQIVVESGEVVNLEIIYTTSKATYDEDDVKAFVLDNYVIEQLPPGTSVYTSFVADEEGTFEYGLEDSNLKGVLVVQ